MALTVIKSTGTDFLANTVSVTSLYNGNVPPIVCNDISTHFSGGDSVFPLTIEQTLITNIVDSKDVTVVINGQYLAPYIKENRWPWETAYDSHRGFRVVGSNLIIYNAPNVGDTAVVTITNTSKSVQTRRYPFSANTIALGD